MAKKDFFLTIDTETTQDGKVADFGAVISDRKGRIYAQCAVLVNGIFTDMDNHPLFHAGDVDPLWGAKTLPARYARYNDMVAGGQRMLASVAAINVWLTKAFYEYNPYLTAYNLAFDLGKCQNTGIDLSMFADKQFCLWHASVTKWAATKKYKQFILDTVSFNKPTDHGNMSYKTNAEVMARFVLDNPLLEDEPHTAIEDVLYYELPILTRLVQTSKKKQWLNPTTFNWRDFQVKDHFIAKQVDNGGAIPHNVYKSKGNAKMADKILTILIILAAIFGKDSEDDCNISTRVYKLGA